ncbi:hypothetical protein PGT21_029753 [Puccinia graminis f. sp. tritici]|uniref:Secreted protein n=2 Tax=Puccinia graminis f. sp. tritici TaxID=56615 RepID=H6QP48_PUCGT|nr:uncharacterized protein PGTG_20761 [Puccinia graminis f. sp. tritici CRL 75-36-700-3]EHS63178.1 hypothetical protein PGTG_20761 [Puccinia graminis f. sp. tritici CRL 75-36-700-3]KAA1118017.1 hypothetical protein PGT21_029753 [Puccinia graminis f. sp. tritici]
MQLLTSTIFIFITVACKLTTCSFPCKTPYPQGACVVHVQSTEGPSETLEPALTARSKSGIYYCPIGAAVCCLPGALVMSHCRSPQH